MVSFLSSVRLKPGKSKRVISALHPPARTAKSAAAPPLKECRKERGKEAPPRVECFKRIMIRTLTANL